MKITIEVLDTGYLIESGSQRHATSNKDTLVKVIRDLIETPEKETSRKIEIRKCNTDDT